MPRLFQPFRRLESDFIKVKGARVDFVDLRAAIETLLPRDTYQIEILSGETGRQTINATCRRVGLDVIDRLRELVMTAVELRLDHIELCTPPQMQPGFTAAAAGSRVG